VSIITVKITFKVILCNSKFSEKQINNCVCSQPFAVFSCYFRCCFFPSVSSSDSETAETLCSEIQPNHFVIVVKEDGIILPCSIHTCLGVVRDHFYVKLGHE
jgi:hypothetical protein